MLLILFLTIPAVFCKEMIVTKEYTDYLKRHVEWEVVDYEDNIFRGWTVDEVKALLIHELPQFDEILPNVEADTALPSKLVWGANCIHGVRNQGQSGASGVYAGVDMLSDRCCIHTGKDHGFLSAQEVISCDPRGGRWPSDVLNYVEKARGIVPEACFPSKSPNTPCPNRCVDGSDWQAAHVCRCTVRRTCIGVEFMKSCLEDGPISVGFYVSRSFMSYKSGIYKCDGSSLGLHAVVAVGYGDDPECHWILRNSWGTNWGMKGYCHMACQTCGVHGTYPSANVACERFVS